jgi:hypothetical protein
MEGLSAKEKFQNYFEIQEKKKIALGPNLAAGWVANGPRGSTWPKSVQPAFP